MSATMIGFEGPRTINAVQGYLLGEEMGEATVSLFEHDGTHVRTIGPFIVEPGMNEVPLDDPIVVEEGRHIIVFRVV